MIWPFKKEKAAPQGPSLSPEETAAQLKQIIAGLTDLIAEDEIDDDTTLFSSRLLDSLSFVELVTNIEGQLGIRVAGDIGLDLDRIDRFGDLLAVVVEASAR